MAEPNVFGAELEPCSTDPMTGFFRDGCCRTGPEDLGSHTICAVVTAEFLDHQRGIGNDPSAITVAGMSGDCAGSDRIAGSNASTAEPFGACRYLGGRSEASALATVFLAIPRRLAIAACDGLSDTCSPTDLGPVLHADHTAAVVLRGAQLSPVDHGSVLRVGDTGVPARRGYEPCPQAA